MREILQTLHDTLRSGKAVAFTSLVETRGSTPQKAGATMLVFPDGSQAGTLGGGCVEAEVKRRALRLLDEGAAEIVSFQLDNDYGWDDGLICGGRMTMLIDPLRPGEDFAYYEALESVIAEGKGCTDAVLIDAQKAGGGAAAGRFLLDGAGKLIAHRGAGDVPDALQRNLKPINERPWPYLADGISYLPRLERCRLVVVGGGHVGQKVAELASECDFDIWVIDDREAYCNPDRFPQAKRLIVAEIDSALSGLEVDPNTFCIITTRGHQHDEEALYHLAETPARYVGMIGSKRKIKLIFEDLLREGIAREALAKVHAPLGFDIGSQTVPEIAVSIVAELVAIRNLGRIPQKPRGGSLIDEVKEREQSSPLSARETGRG